MEFGNLMIVSKSALQNLSEGMLTSLAPCKGIIKYRHTLLVNCGYKVSPDEI